MEGNAEVLFINIPFSKIFNRINSYPLILADLIYLKIHNIFMKPILYPSKFIHCNEVELMKINITYVLKKTFFQTMMNAVQIMEDVATHALILLEVIDVNALLDTL